MTRKERLLLIDLDGVLADCSHRLHWQKAHDYDEFYAAEHMAEDEMIVQGRDLVYALYRVDDNRFSAPWTCKVYLTGRPERTETITRLWVDGHPVLTPDEILFRKDGDYRPSDVVKVEALDAYLEQRYLDNVELKKRELNKYNKLPLEKKRRVWMSELFVKDDNYYVDDDPKNVKAIGEAYPEITCITFGVGRLE